MGTPGVSRKESLRLDVAVGGCAVFLAVFVSALHYGLLAVGPWAVPPRYSGDGLLVLTLLEAANRGEFLPGLGLQMNSFGAPGLADWGAWPVSNPAAWTAGGLVVGVLGLASGANALLLGVHGLSALAMYSVLRAMRVCARWSFAGAVAFAIGQDLFRFGFTPLGLANFCLVPLLLLACHTLLAVPHAVADRLAMALLVAFSVIAGGMASAFVIAYLAVLAAAAAMQFLRERSARGLWPYAAFAAALFVGFLVQMRPSLRFALENGWRFFGVDALGFPVGAGMPAQVGLPEQGLGLDIFLLSAVALIALARLYARFMRGEKFCGWFWCIGALLGALWLAGGAPAWRVMLLAASLGWLAPRLCRWTEGKSRLIRVSALLLVLFAAMAEPFSSRRFFEPGSNAFRKSRSDAEFSAAAAGFVAPGSMVFCYPQEAFAARLSFLRPALWSAALRYSYGNWVQAADVRLPRGYAEDPEGKMLPWLRQRGFTGLLLYRKEGRTGPISKDSDRLRRLLEPAGLPLLLDSHGDFALYRLSPR